MPEINEQRPPYNIQWDAKVWGTLLIVIIFLYKSLIVTIKKMSVKYII